MSILTDIEAKLGQWLASPDVLRTVSAGLRRHSPILVLGHNALVTRHADVLEVLRNDKDFGVTEIYQQKMLRTTGDFILGMENTEQYQREAQFIRAAVRRDDFPRIEKLVDDTAEDLVSRVRASGRIDVVGEYSHRIPLRVVSEYFGTPGPDEPTLARWMRSIFWEIFLNFTNNEDVTQAAEKSSRELSPYLSGLITRRKRELGEDKLSSDDFVSRLVRAQAASGIDDDGVRRNIGGVIVGAVDTQSKAICFALDQLLRHPEALHGAEQAAREGNDALVAEYVWEALRFNPHNPILVRHCRNGATLAAGTERETKILPGTRVYAVTLSAMFDDSVFEHAHEFRLGRPRENYVHFGYGQHRCFGEPLNLLVVPRAVRRLLLLENLRVSMGGWARIDYEGPFPNHYKLEFKPS